MSEEKSVSANVGNRIKLKNGEVAVIRMVQNGNYQVETNTKKIRWVSKDQIEEVY